MTTADLILAARVVDAMRGGELPKLTAEEWEEAERVLAEIDRLDATTEEPS